MQKTLHIPKSPLQFLWFCTKPFGIFALLAFVTVVAAALLETSTYYIFKKLIDTTSQYASGAEAGVAVLTWVVAYPVAAIGHSFLYRFSGLFAMQWITKMTKRGRDVLFEYVSLHSHPYFLNRFSGGINSKIWNATDGIGDLAESVLWQYAAMAVSFVGAFLLVFFTEPRLGFVFFGWMVVLIFSSYFLAKRNRLLSENRSLEKTKLTGTFVDIITNMTAVRQFARRLHEVERVKEGTARLQEASLRSWFGAEFMLILGNVIMGLFIISMLGGVFMLWQQGSVTTGDFIMVLTLMSSFAGWFSSIGNSMNSFARSYGSIQEGLAELLLPHDMSHEEETSPLSVSRGKIDFSDVLFSYHPNSKPVFEQFSLHIPAGERVGLVGPSGSGKSSLMKLLLRDYDLGQGDIKIDGQNIAHVSQDSLHEAIAVVPQEPMLFHRSLRENIAYGKPDATNEEVFEASRKAQIHDFIMTLPEGYETLVGERGVKLSGGQRQRVAIARAILKAAPILVLDEATSSLDSESEVAIQKALNELMKGKTVIAIAHRLSTIRAMDRIIVLEAGSIVQDGTHDELLKDERGTYARLWNHQAGGFLQED